MDIFLHNELLRYEKTLKKYSCYKKNLEKDYKFKSYVLSKDLPRIFNSIRKRERYFIKKDIDIDYALRDEISQIYGFCSILEAERLTNNQKKIVLRLKNKIENIFLSEKGKVYFLTFTFRDDVLFNTDDSTRRTYVRKWLSNNCYDYVANIDFGDENGREHYHALVNSENIDISDWFRKCGAMKYEIVYFTKENISNIKFIYKYDKNTGEITQTKKYRNYDEQITKLANYINKFLHHAIKETTKRQHILYNRKKRKS